MAENKRPYVKTFKRIIKASAWKKHCINIHNRGMFEH